MGIQAGHLFLKKLFTRYMPETSVWLDALSTMVH